jgi:hypothetical protein
MKRESVFGPWQDRLRRIVTHPAFGFIAVVFVVAAAIAVITEVNPHHRTGVVFAPR